MQGLGFLIIAAAAGAVLYQLYAVLGRRVGRHADDKLAAPAPIAPGLADASRPALKDVPAPGGLSVIRQNDPGFDPAQFLQGAQAAYEMIVRAFAEGDRGTLGRLVSAEVLSSFNHAIETREAEGRSEVIQFQAPPRADLESLTSENGLARATVRFLAEFRSRSKGPEGEAVDDRRTAEMWTFERPLASQDPNWLLVRVDAAEA